MKRMTIILTVVSALTACTDRRGVTDKTQRENDSLQEVIAQKDKVIDNYLSAFTEIEKNLDSINKKQKNIYLKTEKHSELNTSLISEINLEIGALNALMEKNRSTIINLNKKLKTSGEKNEQLEAAITALNGQLSDKENELSALKVKLNSYSMKLSDIETTLGYLIVQNYVQEQTIAEETESLHTAYYITGTSKELQQNNVIDKKGGLLGIGKASQLKNDFNADKFKRINYYNTYNIPVNSEKARIITTHSSGSFKFDKSKDTIRNIIITNPEEFWKASKYLVVVKN